MIIGEAGVRPISRAEPVNDYGAMADRKLIQAVEAYFTDLRWVRGSGGATEERSLYVPLVNLLDARVRASGSTVSRA